MGLKSGGRNLSFEILGFSQYDDVFHAAEADSDLTFVPDDKKRKNKKKKKKKKAKKNREGNAIHDESVISEDAIHDFSAIDADVGYTRTSAAIFPADVDSCPAAKSEGLRQRNVGFLMNGGNEELTVEDTGSCPRDDEANVDRENSPEIFTSDHVVELPRRTIEKEESLDWKKLMAKDPNETAPIEYSPMKYFMEEMYAGNSLRSTTSMGNDKERERVYDTIFRLPWRCELLIDFGFFVCLDSFLSLFTIMPTRIAIAFWRVLKTR
ncbi:hypothetical protein M569_16905 [Genlisea aurea]|uniref:Uncharacterized protein n=1 Tax=Genlisea aurea TaxID=192259 RepID=S8DEX6_9LAMI|nr:hypothetical protein M569_16905 [Genlisea aurea]